MLAVHQGKTKAAGWNELLKSVYSYATAQPDAPPAERHILILTDTWSPQMLDKLEKKLLPVYFKGNLGIHAVLYTYCGFTDIPLITNRPWVDGVPQKPDLDRQLMWMAGSTFSLTFRPSVLNRFATGEHYEVDIYARRMDYARHHMDYARYMDYIAVIKKSDRDSEKTLYAGRAAVKKFAAALMNLPQHPIQEQKMHMLDAPGFDFNIQELIPRQVTDTYGDRTRGKVVRAFMDLVRTAVEDNPWKDSFDPF